MCWFHTPSAHTNILTALVYAITNMLITVNTAGVVTMACCWNIHHMTLQDKHRNAARLLLTTVKNISLVSNNAHHGKHYFIFCIYENRSYTVTCLCRYRGEVEVQLQPVPQPALEWHGWSATCSGCFTPRKDMVPIVLEGAGVGLRASLDSRENLAPTKIGL
jgi:hypothetical protein